jgi:hypothetical protein
MPFLFTMAKTIHGHASSPRSPHQASRRRQRPHRASKSNPRRRQRQYSLHGEYTRTHNPRRAGALHFRFRQKPSKTSSICAFQHPTQRVRAAMCFNRSLRFVSPMAQKRFFAPKSSQKWCSAIAERTKIRDT